MKENTEYTYTFKHIFFDKNDVLRTCELSNIYDLVGKQNKFSPWINADVPEGSVLVHFYS